MSMQLILPLLHTFKPYTKQQNAYSKMPLTMQYTQLAHTISHSHLILSSSLLTSLKLIKIPPTNAQRALILIHTLAESIDIVCASASRGALGVRLLLSVLLREVCGLGRCFGCGRGGGSAEEEIADCVAD